MWFGCLVGALATFAMLLVLVGGLALLAVLTAMAAGASETSGIYAGVHVQERTVSGEPGGPKVALIPVQGLLLQGGMGLGGDPVATLQAMLERAKGDAQVHAVVLTVDSGGGGITTCDIMRKAVRDFRLERQVPVVALFGDVAASGAYYISCAADRIVAHPTTITGSIGVMMPLYDASGLMRKLGVEDRTVKSGRYKNLTSPFAQKTEEEIRIEQELLTGIVEEMHERFVQVVAEGRGMTPDEVRPLADGSLFTGEQAVQKGLVDEVGYIEDAVKAAEKLAGVSAAHVVQYGRAPTLRDLLIGRAEAQPVRVELADPLPMQGRACPMYLWSGAER